jgi:hypothetical protein
MFPLVSHHVAFSVNKNHNVYVGRKFFHSGDWLDPSFELAYPDYEWISEATLRLYDADAFNSQSTDTVRVINRTSEVV